MQLFQVQVRTLIFTVRTLNSIIIDRIRMVQVQQLEHFNL